MIGNTQFEIVKSSTASTLPVGKNVLTPRLLQQHSETIWDAVQNGHDYLLYQNDNKLFMQCYSPSKRASIASGSAEPNNPQIYISTFLTPELLNDDADSLCKTILKDSGEVLLFKCQCCSETHLRIYFNADADSELPVDLRYQRYRPI